MKNTFLYGFTNSPAGLTALPNVLTSEKICNVVLTVGEEGTDYDIRSFFYGTFPKKKFRGCPDHIYDQVYPCLLTYLDMIDRYHRFQNKFYPDYIDNFNRVLDFFYDEFVEKKIERVIFANVNHEGTDVLIYHLAKAMGIDVFILCPSIFPDRFFFAYDLEDFGTFAQNPIMTPPEPFSIPRQHEKELFYMTNVKPFDYPFKTMWRHLRTYKMVAVMFYLKNKAYKKAIQNIPETNIDLSKPYVYVPLHYQPEMTTTGLGGKYVDQALAIEKIAKMIPNDWYIYVKENPIQSFEFRGDWFFDRLKAIPNLKVTPPDMNTYSLIQNSRFVATITGTAGWEAVTGGKCAVTFGKAWYNTMPGIFRYHEKLDAQEIANYEISHEAVEEAVSQLIARTGVGIIDSDFLRISKHKDNFDKTQNVKIVAESFAKIIAHRDSIGGVPNLQPEPAFTHA